MDRKEKEVSIIGGADGPTSIFLAGKFPGEQPRPLKWRIRQCIYHYRRKRAAKKVSANPHTLKQVAAYAKKKYHAAEIPKTKRQYAEQYKSAKEGLILTHKPQLLGSLQEIACPDVLDKKAAKELLRQSQLRSKMAAKVPDSEMPMDFHIFQIRIAGGQMEIAMDYRWGLFGPSYSGDKKAMKKLKKIARELYLYYGVSQEDIQNKTQRYLSLLSAISGST